MNVLQSVGDLLKDYMDDGSLNRSTSGAAGRPARNVEEDFDRVSSDPDARPALGDALAGVFRSERTPAFPDMLSDLFSRSDGTQKADLLRTLLSAAGPALAAKFGGSLGAQRPEDVTPETAERADPEEVRRLASESAGNDESVIDKVSGFYASHPSLVKTIGSAALTLAMAHLARRSRVM